MIIRTSRLNELALHLLRAAFSAYVRDEAGHGHLEVERKFRLNPGEPNRIKEVLQIEGFSSIGLAVMSDTFLPNLVPGEMLRVRREKIDDADEQTIFTFKKWVTTKHGQERHETERVVRPAVASFWLVIGRLLNGESMLSFSKRRHLYQGQLDGHECVVSVDDVDGLGKFSGWYLEVELLVPVGEDPRPYSDKIFPLVEKLLGEKRAAESRSYREMLITSLQR